MEKLIFRCLECGQSKEILETLENVDKEQCFCPMCGSNMELQGAEGLVDINHLVRLDTMKQMKKNISELGNDKTWSIIEALSNAKMRIAFRKIFFEAGGCVAEQRGN